MPALAVTPDGAAGAFVVPLFVAGAVGVSFLVSPFDAAGAAAPNHDLTPPCLEQAPCSVLAVENVPSVH